MLTIAKDHILGSTQAPRHQRQRRHPPVRPGGQPRDLRHLQVRPVHEVRDGRDAENILFGSTLSNDRTLGRSFDYLIANPPYGKDWKRDEDAVQRRARPRRRRPLRAGPPRISDGQLLFLLHMLAHMKQLEEGGSRVAIIMNGSPLFTGDAGSGESEIRRWILENDWLEALVALPEQLFYNTGIATYVWVLTNRKAPERGARCSSSTPPRFWTPMRKSLGDKRRESPRRAKSAADRSLRAASHDYEEGELVAGSSRPPTSASARSPSSGRCGSNFQATPERIARLEEERGLQEPGQVASKKGAARADEEEAAGAPSRTRIRRAARRACQTRSSRTAPSSTEPLQRPRARRPA